MASKPQLLDLFCGGGGASAGYVQAGFDVIGVDIAPQPHYPFSFYQADALEFLSRYGGDFAYIHASPPCQAYSRLRGLTRKTYPDLVPVVRQLLHGHGVVHVIENVPGSPLHNPLLLCGTMFDLRDCGAVLYRHRLFESSAPLRPPRFCQHVAQDTVMTVTGSTPQRFVRGGKNETFPVVQARKLMGISWLPMSRLSQAIPPVYTAWIGRQLLMQGDEHDHECA